MTSISELIAINNSVSSVLNGTFLQEAVLVSQLNQLLNPTAEHRSTCCCLYMDLLAQQVLRARRGSHLFAYAGDLLLYLWVLAELGKNLLRFNRKSRPQWKLAVPLFVVAAVLIGSLSRWAATPSRTLLANICFLTMRADGALEFAGFLALISWSGLRKLRWPERELRIATGFGFVAFVWFLVSLLEFKWNAGPVYYWLYQSGQAAGLAALAYWLYYFWIDAEREPAVRDAAAGPDGASNRNDPDGAQRLGMV